MNIWKIIYLNCVEKYEDKNDNCSFTHNLGGCKIKPEKNSGLNGIRIHDHCDTGAVLYNLLLMAKFLNLRA